MDFQNDAKCVFAPPTKYYDEYNKLYQYLHMAKNDIQNMSNEYCEHLLNSYYNNQNKVKNKETKEEKKQTINKPQEPIKNASPNVLSEIKMMALKMKCFDSYQTVYQWEYLGGCQQRQRR